MTHPDTSATGPNSDPKSTRHNVEFLLASIVESSDDAIIGKGLDGTITSWNPGAEHLYGYRADEVVGHNVSLITPQDRLHELADVLMRISRGERIDHYETRRVRKDGTILDISITVSPIRDESGVIVGASAIGRTISDRISLERERFGALLAAAPDAIVGVNVDGTIAFASDRVQAIFGWSPDELVGQQVEILVPEAMMSTHVEHRARYSKNPHPREMDGALKLHGRRKDGTTFPAEISLSAHVEAEGALLVFAAVRDVTELRRREREHQERQALFDEFGRHTDMGLMVRQGTQVLYANPALFRISGIDPDSPAATLLDLWAAVHPDDSDTAAALAAAANTGHTTNGELRVIRPDGDIKWIHNAQIPMSQSEDGQWLVASSVVDITARKKAEETARSAQLEAERSNLAKTEFLSRMSHELRTPLNAILGFGQLLETEAQGVEDQESARHIVRAGEHLLELIDEALDISRMETGDMHLSLEPVFLRDVADETLQMLRPLAERRDIRVTVAQPGLDVYVRADRQRLKQVLVNLLANAVKYNRDGGAIRIDVERRDPGRVRMTVSDTGIGIEQHDLGRLFQPFERLAAEQSTIEGTGLGLALTKQLIGAMRGDIGASSRVGEGSSFWFELSVADAPYTESLEVRSPRRRVEELAVTEHKTILYVEDNLSNVRLMERIFSRQPNIELMVAGQGSTALEMAMEHVPDLILLDLHLPDMAGEEILLRLCSDTRTANIPVVIMSADATLDRPQQLLAKGAVDYLTKPFELPRLYAVINNLEHRLSASSDQAPAESPLPAEVARTTATGPTDSARRVPDVAEFLHELNNQLGVILNYSEMVARSASDPTMVSDLGAIRSATERAIELAHQFQPT